MPFLLDHLLAEIVAYSNVTIVRTDVKTSSSIHVGNLVLIIIWAWPK